MNDEQAFEVCDATREAVELEDQLRADASERAAEINSPGCEPEAGQSWYDALPIEAKLRIQMENAHAAECFATQFDEGSPMRRIWNRVAEKMRIAIRETRARSETGNGSGVGLAPQTPAGRE